LEVANAATLASNILQKLGAREREPMTNVFNPYDFTNPVTNMSVLADRNHEREEIDYYLDFALNAPRHINIALVGQRASGKTSLLNYIEFAALKKKFITYRIDLDEENVSSSYAFFFKIFDSLLSEAVKAGYLGGVTGKFLDVYREVTSTFNTTVDSEWTPFSFPMMYARVMSARTAELAPFPDNDFATDLDRLWKMGDRKFCLIFDECDLLGNSRGVLQKLRNIIQKSNGFMFVFAGTPKLFPVMDDVFSPIVRQFKKIEVRDFVEIDDIRECILNPLKLLDDRDPGDFFPLDNESLVREIHTLTSGRPYEVQLLCHSIAPFVTNVS
jgi:Cdc6-like AAA superfamily ATPase